MPPCPSWKTLVAILLGMTTACGGREDLRTRGGTAGSPAMTANQGASTPNAVYGTFAGQSLSVQSAASTAVIPNEPEDGESSLDITLASDPDICALLVPLTSNDPPFIHIPGLFLSLDFEGSDPTGTYPIAVWTAGFNEAPPFALVSYESGPPGCPGTINEEAVSGTVNVSGFEPDAGIRGTFDVTMGAQTANGGVGPATDHITGSFNAALCNTYTDLQSCYDVACPGIVANCN